MARRRSNIQRPLASFNVNAYFRIHLRTLFSSLGRFSRAPFNSMMTVSVIAITLSLPAGLLVSINNLQTLSGQVDLNHNMSIFLQPSLTLTQAEVLSHQLQTNDLISQATLIDKQAALDEFRQHSGFNLAIGMLEDNPLPHVIQVSPNTDNQTAVKALIAELEQHAGIQLVQMDLAWLERLNGFLQIAQRAASLITALLGLAVLLIISNTIRLELQNRRDEIDITRLVGATPAFIMRPFIYSGFWHGLFGGVLACLLVNLSIWLIDSPTSSLANLYNSSFSLQNMSFYHAILWVIFAISLGITGSWVVVKRYLTELER